MSLYSNLFLPGALGTVLDLKSQTDPESGIAAVANKGLRLLAWDPPGYGKSRPHEKR